MARETSYGGGSGGGGNLSPAATAVLNNWTYDEPTNTLSTNASLKAGLNSFSLGDMHTMSSGGENVFFKNNSSDIHWFPRWQGVREYTGDNTPLVVAPTTRVYVNNGVPVIITPVGANAHATTNIAYTQIVTLTQNESVVRLEVVLGEDYTGDMTYTLRDTTQTGIMKFSQVVAVDGVEGDPLVFIFHHPSESFEGDIIAVDMVKEDDTPMLVRASATIDTAPWVRITLCVFSDELSGLDHIYYVDANKNVTINGTNLVDTTTAGITLTVPNTFRGSFKVHDADESFSVANPCTVAFGGTQGDAVLQVVNDSFLFYYAENEWKFLDLATNRGGTV